MRKDKYGVFPKTEQELLDYLHEVENQTHDYNTIAQALTDVTVAMFNYFASKQGMTGFQCSWSGLQFLKTTRGMDSPFAIVDGSRLLYPQYDLHNELDGWIKDWMPEISKMAREKLEKDSDHASVNVVDRWKQLARYSNVQ